MRGSSGPAQNGKPGQLQRLSQPADVVRPIQQTAMWYRVGETDTGPVDRDQVDAECSEHGSRRRALQPGTYKSMKKENGNSLGIALFGNAEHSARG
jgi:hypothetical protein